MQTKKNDKKVLGLPNLKEKAETEKERISKEEKMKENNMLNNEIERPKSMLEEFQERQMNDYKNELQKWKKNKKKGMNLSELGPKPKKPIFNTANQMTGNDTMHSKLSSKFAVGGIYS